MPALDRVNAPSSRFLYTFEGEFTLIDLAYEEYIERDLCGAANAHVEAYWAYLASKEEDHPLR